MDEGGAEQLRGAGDLIDALVVEPLGACLPVNTGCDIGLKRRDPMPRGFRGQAFERVIRFGERARQLESLLLRSGLAADQGDAMARAGPDRGEHPVQPSDALSMASGRHLAISQQAGGAEGDPPTIEKPDVEQLSPVLMARLAGRQDRGAKQSGPRHAAERRDALHGLGRRWHDGLASQIQKSHERKAAIPAWNRAMRAT
ncbi:hypothetical protein IT40_07500 [Paracoccus versutus]|nr:hypothetical protein IT40_07500 [Paracoccus versutus]